MSLGRDYPRYDGMGLASLVARGELHPTELLEEALRRAEAVNPRLGAMVLTMEEEARRQIAQGETAGPLGGVPFALKDLRAQYAGTPTSSGSRFFAGSVADYDTETVRRHRAAGLVTFGKTKTPELGCNLATEPRRGGPARNPWDTALIPGGSSGGAAALVAARVDSPRPRHGRRRVDQDPGHLLWAVRAQAHPRPNPGRTRPGGRLGRSEHRARGHPNR